jgi:hypothetical protein
MNPSEKSPFAQLDSTPHNLGEECEKSETALRRAVLDY